MRALRLSLPVVLAGSFLWLATPGAQALSCAMSDQVVQDAERLFTGTVKSAEGNRLLVDVVDDLGPVAVPDQVQVGLRLETWWSDGGSPRDSSAVWLFALSPGQNTINPCNAWTEGGEYGYPAALEGTSGQEAEPEVPVLNNDQPPGADPVVVPGDAATEVPDESWNAETNPDMARLADQGHDVQASGSRHSTAELAGWAGAGLGLGAVLLAGLMWRTRRPRVD